MPELPIPQDQEPHTSSIDVDLAVNHLTMPEVGYKTILELLEARGYRTKKQPLIFPRVVKVNDHDVNVKVDFLTGEYAGTGLSHRTQKVQDLQPRKAKGADLASDQPQIITLQGTLPDQEKDAAQAQLASLPKNSSLSTPQTQPPEVLGRTIRQIIEQLGTFIISRTEVLYVLPYLFSLAIINGETSVTSLGVLPSQE